MIIYTTKRPAEIRELAQLMSAMMSDGMSPLRKFADGIKMATAYQFFSLVKQAFIAKSRGGTDESGDSWKPLSPEYLAYSRRFGRGEQAALKKAAGLGRANSQYIGNGQTLLDKKQADLWWATYRRVLSFNVETLPLREAKAIAAGAAWNVVKRAGGKTKLMVYGKRQVEILRDTGVLLNSLSPGVLADRVYAPPPPSGYGGQVVRTEPGALIVGTNVRYAGAHHYGKRVPQRRLWPDGNRLPQRWISLISQRLTNGVIRAVKELSS